MDDWTLPRQRPTRTPEHHAGFLDNFPAVSRELFTEFFHKGGALIIIPGHTLFDTTARAKLCATRDEAREFVKGFTVQDIASSFFNIYACGRPA